MIITTLCRVKKSLNHNFCIKLREVESKNGGKTGNVGMGEIIANHSHYGRQVEPPYRPASSCQFLLSFCLYQTLHRYAKAYIFSIDRNKRASHSLVLC